MREGVAFDKIKNKTHAVQQSPSQGPDHLCQDALLVVEVSSQFIVLEKANIMHRLGIKVESGTSVAIPNDVASAVSQSCKVVHFSIFGLLDANVTIQGR